MMNRAHRVLEPTKVADFSTRIARVRRTHCNSAESRHRVSNIVFEDEVWSFIVTVEGVINETRAPG